MRVNADAGRRFIDGGPLGPPAVRHSHPTLVAAVSTAVRRASVLVGVLVACLLADAAGALAQPLFVPVTDSPFSTSVAYPTSVAFSPSGGLLATADYNFTGKGVSIFSVGSDGALTPVSGSPFAAGGGEQSVAFSPSGSLLATADSATGPSTAATTVTVFSVGSDGTLTNAHPVTSGAQPWAVAFSPSGHLLAAANYGDNTVSVFSVAANGTATKVAGYDLGGGNVPVSVAFSPSGGLLAVATSEGVRVLSVGSNGSLTNLAGSPLAAGEYMKSVAFSPSGGLLAAVSVATGENPDETKGASSVWLFSVGSDDTLAPVSGSPFAAGMYAESVAFNPSGRLVAVANNDWPGAVTVFAVGPGGHLTPVEGSPFGAGNGSVSVAFSPAGRLLAVANSGDDTVSVFSGPAAPVAITPPSISGTAAPGQTLTTDNGSWTNNPDTYSYQWEDCDSAGENCVPIDGATSSSYTLTTGDAGHTIVVVVTATNLAGSAGANSTPTVVVPPPHTPAAPVVQGGPNATTAATTATVTWAGEEGGSFQCGLDGGAYAACTSPLQLTALEVGQHTLLIRQLSDEGVAGPPTSVSWTVESAPSTPPARGPLPVGTTPKVTLATVAIATSTASSHARSTTIGCELTHALIHSCATTLTARVHGRTIVVGHGTVTVSDGAQRVAVTNHLTARALRLANRPGGLKIHVRATITVSGVSTVLHATGTTHLVLPHVLVIPSDGMFASRSAVIERSSLPYLAKLRSELAGVRDIGCVGYTDSLGGVAYNLALGQARAKAVCEFLTHGLAIHVRASSMGEADPRASNATDSGRALNRRVEVHISYT